MKIDFYDLFSLHTPQDFPETGEENYITAAVKSRVMENIPADRSKPVRIRKIGRAFLAAAAAVVVLVTGTFAASALGLIDLEKIFGGMFRSGSENLDGIMSVPKNVVITGDDRLSLKVLGIAGTENQFVGAIEIKRNDGGAFPQYIKAKVNGGFDEDNFFNDSSDLLRGPIWYDGIPPAVGFYVVDETTAIYYFSGGINPFPYLDEASQSIMGKTYTVKLSNFVDCTELENILQKYDVYIDNDEDAARVEYLLENEDVILDGEWFITFPIEYDISCRTVSVNEPLSGHGISSSVITEVKYSAISLDFYLDDVYGELSLRPNDRYDVSIKLADGRNVAAIMSCGDFYVAGGNPAELHYYFNEAIDVDSVETITIGDIVIPVK